MKINYSCPICKDKAVLRDVVDFNRNCEGIIDEQFPVLGKAVYYAKCKSCDLIYAPEFSNWSHEDFAREIYNEKYSLIDPDYLIDRPKRNKILINNIFMNGKTEIKHLDYGGGNGSLSELLKSDGWDSTSFDPFSESENQKINSDEKFNLITAFEVFEHVADPNELINDISRFASDNCLIFFSTGIHDNQITSEKRLDWWYVAPRNGHITIYSHTSLQILANKHGLKFGSMGSSFHCYWNNFPSWATSLYSA